jgi:hypothetical protein
MEHALYLVLEQAAALAAFANLEPEDVAKFRHDRPNFVPHDFWSGSSMTGVSGVIQRTWQEDQKMVLAAWRNGFGPDEGVALIVRGSNYNFMSEGIQKTSELLLRMDASEATEYLKDPTHFIHPKVFDLQRAVMFLHVQSWRAAYCVRCGKHFVRAAKGSKFCSEKCFDANRSRSQLDYWRKRGTKLRAERNKANKK